MTDLFSLEGMHILVTGGTRGIGRAIVTRFAQAGGSVIANYARSDTSAAELQQEADAAGYRVTTCRADVTTSKGLDHLTAVLDAKMPRISAFVHCAATGVHKSFDELTLRHFDWTYGLNVRAFFELVQRLLPRLDANASILAISSEGATRAIPYYSLVGSSKGALESLARHLAVELAPRGIRVNVLSPGAVRTDAWTAIPDADRRLADTAHRSPIGRLNTLDEVACAAQFLCSRAATGVIGQTLVVDGGLGIAR